MKYLKLWEAFKSEILSKTMAFLSDSGKVKFSDELKRITNYISYPLSELSDEYFQKLNFDKALKLNFNREDSVCDATSDRSYPDHEVEGAVCDKGMVDRKWGRGIRKAQCTVCGGTGIKPVANPNPKWIKFWFDKNGNYITKSAVDGVIRGDIFKVSGEVTDTKSGVVYKKVSEITLASEFRNFSTGTKFWINLNNINTVATLFKPHPSVAVASDCYMIQDVADGSSPNGTDWKRFGRCSWVVRSNDNFKGKAYLLEEKDEEEEEYDKVLNPYAWNAKLDLSRRTMSCTDYPSLKDELKSASFAIVLNVLDLYKSEYKTLVSTRKEREESKSGALALMTDEQIRDANAQKYLEEISKRIQINSDLVNLKKGVLKIIGSNFVGYHLFNSSTGNELNKLESYIYQILKDDEIEWYLKTANNLIKNQLEYKSDENTKITRNLDSMISTLSRSMNESDRILVDIINKFKTFMQIVYKMISAKEINSLRDLKVLRLKLRNVRDAMRDSREFSELWETIRELVGYIHYDTDPARTLRYIRSDDTATMNTVLEQFDEFIETAKELLK
jgi:hypothetical protein